MKEPRPIKHDFVLIDLMRGISAFLVMISHARNFVLVDFGEGVPSVVRAIFYVGTGLGRFSVIIFFVLSGFLISQSVCRIDWRAPASVISYLIARLVRLWVVLLPALLLTACWDWSAMSLANPDFYQGLLGDFHSGPQGPAKLDFWTFVRNVMFLQTIVCPVYGSNTPLWSLACEFWYYLAFPALYFILLPFGRVRPLIVVAVAGVAFVSGKLYNLPIVALFAAWIVGYIAMITPADKFNGRTKGFLFLAGVNLLAVVLVASRFKWLTDFDVDLIEAVAVGAIVVAGCNWRFPRSWKIPISASAEISYSLYLTHFPLLAFLSAVVLGNQRFSFGSTGLILLALAAVACIAQAVLVYVAFERHTGLVRNKITAWLIHRSARTNATCRVERRRKPANG